MTLGEGKRMPRSILRPGSDKMLSNVFDKIAVYNRKKGYQRSGSEQHVENKMGKEPAAFFDRSLILRRLSHP
ncbi:MAG TPA: hypothetical protein VLJ16_07395, partial [Acidobacteriota bacterium]|nr:hypothetical protein [Acidobacteriota bacterium]